MKLTSQDIQDLGRAVILLVHLSSGSTSKRNKAFASLSDRETRSVLRTVYVLVDKLLREVRLDVTVSPGPDVNLEVADE